MRMSALLLGGLLLILPSARWAEASALYHLDVSGGFSGSGIIGLSTDSGSGVGDITQFEFSVGNAQFGMADITSANWSTGTSLTLALTASIGTIASPGDMIYELALNNSSTPLPLCDFEPELGARFCVIENLGDRIVSTGFSGDLAAAAVPLPSSALSMIAGLMLVASLGWGLRGRQLTRS